MRKVILADEIFEIERKVFELTLDLTKSIGGRWNRIAFLIALSNGILVIDPQLSLGLFPLIQWPNSNRNINRIHSLQVDLSKIALF